MTENCYFDYRKQRNRQTRKKMIGVEFEMDFFFREYQIATGIFDGLVESIFD